MPSDQGTNGNARLDALRKREADIKAAIAEEKVRQQKRAEKDHARLASIIGECLLADMKVDPKLALLLEESLKRNASPRDAEFLRHMGWRI
jgi:hypothetical protein